MTSYSARREGLSEIVLREVIVSYDDNGEKKILRLITSLLHPSAQAISSERAVAALFVLKPIEVFPCFADQKYAFVFTICERFHIDRVRITIAKINAFADFAGNL